MTKTSKLSIAVIGDVHDLWSQKDNLALKKLGVDLALFVGDFGNESVEIVKIIAELDLPKAVITGNHDAWYSATNWGKTKAPYDRNKEDRVQQQLDILGKTHVGYSKLDFPQLGLSVVGSRPFSWGGPEWRNTKFYSERFGINSFAESTNKIIESVEKTKFDNIIFIAHNGPKGLGDKPEDICGKDWGSTSGDYGDLDLTEAIDKTLNLGKLVPLVTFGHMHHDLRHNKDRLRTMVKKSDLGTIYFNAARVPRIKKEASNTIRNFSLVTMENYTITQISLVWLDDNLEISVKENIYIAPEN